MPTKPKNKRSSGNNPLTGKLGPLPGWAWLAGGGVGYWWYRRRQAAQAAQQASAANAQTNPIAQASGVGDYQLPTDQYGVDYGTGYTGGGGGTAGGGTTTTGDGSGGSSGGGGGGHPKPPPRPPKPTGGNPLGGNLPGKWKWNKQTGSWQWVQNSPTPVDSGPGGGGSVHPAGVNRGGKALTANPHASTHPAAVVPPAGSRRTTPHETGRPIHA